jgi:hypothetical protein
MGESLQGLQLQSLTLAGAQYEATVNLQSFDPKSELYVQKVKNIRADRTMHFFIK